MDERRITAAPDPPYEPQRNPAVSGAAELRFRQPAPRLMGDRMKIAIVLAAILLAAWAAVLAIRPDLVRPTLVQKSDIYGLAPGMTLEEVNKLITQRKYRCRPVQDYVIECSIDAVTITITAEGEGNMHPVRRIAAELSGRDPEATVRSISAQYNAEPAKGPDGNWVWTVGSGFKLRYDGNAVTLFDERAGKRER
jgi:hypothetical protein